VHLPFLQSNFGASLQPIAYVVADELNASAARTCLPKRFTTNRFGIEAQNLMHAPLVTMLTLLPIACAPHVAAGRRPAERRPDVPRGSPLHPRADAQAAHPEDPYRWLEDTANPRVAAWFAVHDARTRARFGADPQARALQRRREAIALSLRDSEPLVAQVGGGNASHVRPAANTRLRVVEGAVVLGAEPSQVQVFPRPDPAVTYTNIELSPDGKWALVELSASGKDRREWRVQSIEHAAQSADQLVGIEDTSTVWDVNACGFYYAFTPTDVAHAIRFGAREIRFHRVGTPQSTDRLVLPANHDRNAASGTGPIALLSTGVVLVQTASGYDASRFAIASAKPDGDQIEPLSPAAGIIESVVADGANVLEVVRLADGTRVVDRVTRSLAQSARTLRRIASTQHFIGISMCCNSFVLEFGTGHSQRFEIADRELRTLMTWTVAPGNRESLTCADGRIQVKSSGLLQPGTTSELDVARHVRTPVAQKLVGWDPAPYVVESVAAVAADGERIPIEVVRKHDAALDGRAPLWIYGYGGFQVAQFPGFSTLVASWLERGGIYAVAHLRGGVERGQDWHRTAIKTNHFVSVEDYAASVRALHLAGYGSPATTMLHGVSHGGLVVARAAIEWPALARLALIEVPLLDMLRFAEFGRGGVSEYGDPDNVRERAALEHLSALHAVRAGVHYPQFYVTAATLDERAHPMHAAKLVEALTRAHADNEVWLKVDFRGGHLSGGNDPELAAADALALLLSGATP
jgi:prolyl oligopeptidase